ncbi:MAG: hypothetical protein PHF94_07955, partial [Methanothrix sp.]|nr:hypothetical protein [Methanothrix sp.]
VSHTACMKGVAQTTYLIELQVLSFLKKLQTVFCAKKEGPLGQHATFYNCRVSTRCPRSPHPSGRGS